VVNNGDGTVTYTPTSPTFEGSDSFTYTVTDGAGATDQATVTVNVTGQITPVFSVAGVTDFNGSSGDVINLASTPGGHHFASYVEGGKLKVRFQDEDSSASFEFANLQAGQEYEVAAVFDASGVEFYVDGNLIAQSALVMDWSLNNQFLQVGGLGWGSGDGAANFLGSDGGCRNLRYCFGSKRDPDTRINVFI